MDQSDFQRKISGEISLTFDDVLLIPNYIDIKREEIDLMTQLTHKIRLKIPLLSSPMDTVTTSHMAIALGLLGGLGIIHRNMDITSQAKEVTRAKEKTALVGAAVGIGRDFEERVDALVSSGVDVLVVDSAHGFSKWVMEATKLISHKYKDVGLIAGNVATAAGAKALIEAGAGGIRVGMGPGSICTTRVISGMGVPQISAILEVSSLCKKYGVPVISDGGVRFSGDIVKAIAVGASTIMLGSLFAGCLEAPGKIVKIKDEKYKVYRGMGSVAAMKEGSSSRYDQEYRKGQEKKLIAEGIEGMVLYSGTVEDTIVQLTGGLRSGMYYAGVKNIKELQEKTRLIKITQASLVESHPHDIISVKG